MQSHVHQAPSHALPAASPVPFLAGLSEDRLARVATRLAFVEMKTSFMRAAAQARGPDPQALQRQVRLAAEVTDLWRVSGALLAHLPPGNPQFTAIREELQYHLDSAFRPDGATKPFQA